MHMHRMGGRGWAIVHAQEMSSFKMEIMRKAESKGFPFRFHFCSWFGLALFDRRGGPKAAFQKITNCVGCWLLHKYHRQPIEEVSTVDVDV